MKIKKEDLKKILIQIKKYNLEKAFENEKELKLWLSQLSDNEIRNFINLNINLDEIEFPLKLLINKNLLNCSDYSQRVNALSKLKNGDGCWHLFDELCNKNFIKSPNFYHDIEQLSKAESARYGLWVIADEDFIKSPYHKNDLKLITEACNVNKKYPKIVKIQEIQTQDDSMVAEALAIVASNKDSIKSPYHETDMELISKANGAYLSFPSSEKNGMDSLAINNVSLKDPYHLENMKILSQCVLAREFLYKIMTDPNIIKNKYYRNEIQALVNAKNKQNAKAIYYYIANPKEKFIDIDYVNFLGSECNKYNEIDSLLLADPERVSANKNSDYLKNLEIINEIPSDVVIYYTSLLMNKKFLNNPYSKEDLKLLQTISDKNLFIDIYKYIIQWVDLPNTFHNSDLKLLIKTNNIKTRQLLLQRMANYLGSLNREYDLNYILKIDIDKIDQNYLSEIKYYLLNLKGINDPEHISSLEKLNQGILPLHKNSEVLNYIYRLEKEITENDENTTKFKENNISDNNEEKEKPLVLSFWKKFSKK